MNNKKARLDIDGTAKPLTHIIAHYNYIDGKVYPVGEGQGAHAYEFKNHPIDGYVSINDKNNDDYTEEGIFKDWHTIRHKCKDGDGLIHIDGDPKIGIRTPEQDKIHRENMINLLFDRGAKEK